MTGFWEYRRDQEGLGKANGVQSLGSKAIGATAQGIVAGIVYGTISWAYFPDKLAFAHKNTVTSGPSRGFQYVQHTMIRPAVAFSVIGVTYAAVESFLEEVKGDHQKDPWNSATAGAAAGMVMGGFFTRRFDMSVLTGLGMSVLMGMVEMNGSSFICDPVTEAKKKFPSSIAPKFEESDELSGLKDKYPAYKNN